MHAAVTVGAARRARRGVVYAVRIRSTGARFMNDDVSALRATMGDWLPAILDGASEIVAVKDRGGRHVLVNRAHEELGLTRAAILGRTNAAPFREDGVARIAHEARALAGSIEVEALERSRIPGELRAFRTARSRSARKAGRSSRLAGGGST